MIIKPILFSTPMVQAILNGTKTQTRRVIKPQPNNVQIIGGKRIWDPDVVQPKYALGDILWVRETFGHTKQINISLEDEHYGYVYKATDKDWESFEGWKWKPSIFMPKQACRLWLKVTFVAVQRLREITENQSLKEGIVMTASLKPVKKIYRIIGQRNYYDSPKEAFQNLWQSINGKESWQSNPYVWVYKFEKCEMPSKFLN